MSSVRYRASKVEEVVCDISLTEYLVAVVGSRSLVVKRGRLWWGG